MQSSSPVLREREMEMEMEMEPSSEGSKKSPAGRLFRNKIAVESGASTVEETPAEFLQTA